MLLISMPIPLARAHNFGIAFVHGDYELMTGFHRGGRGKCLGQTLLQLSVFRPQSFKLESNTHD